MLASSIVQFGSWIPLGELLGAAPPSFASALPHEAGLFQLRVEEGLLSYPQGKSAMVAYGAGSDVGAALREFLSGPAGPRAQALGPLLVRFASTGAHLTPALYLTRLHERFRSQFGSLPRAEVDAADEAPATEK